jgi:hypothetical protein
MNLVDDRKLIAQRGWEVSDLMLTIEYEDRPSFLRALFLMLKSCKEYEKPLLIIDSIEAVEKSIDSPIVEDLIKISERKLISIYF